MPPKRARNKPPDPDVGTKRPRRPDVALRMKDAKNWDQYVVKSSLQRILGEKSIMPALQTLVLQISRAVNRGSLVFNRMLLHCLETRTPLPSLSSQALYQQCLNIVTGTLASYCPQLVATWKLYFARFPRVETCPGFPYAIISSAKTYQTNFLNSLFMCFKARQKAYVIEWCKAQKLDPKLCAFPLVCAVNNWVTRSEVLSGMKDADVEVYRKCKCFVRQQQTLLGVGEAQITEAWLKAHSEELVRYYYQILQFLEGIEDTRRFKLAPMSHIKCHYVTVDDRVLYSLMSAKALVKCTFSEFASMREEHFGSVFNLQGLSKKGFFTCRVETDGVSASTHFKRPSARAPGPKRKRTTVDSSAVTALSEAPRVIAIDPGRANILYGVERVSPTETKTYCLTRGQYYTSSGMHDLNRECRRWQAKIAGEEAIYAAVSPKTSNGAVLDAFLGNYVQVYDALWTNKTMKKRARGRFRVFRLKRKVLDIFFASMSPKGSAKPLIAYGAAQFNPTGPGELSVPTSAVSKVCARHYQLQYVDEYNTTKVCNGCKQYSWGVKFGEGRVNRGLRWCSSTKCRKFLNRDHNAALNILECATQTPRPLSFSREFSSVAKALQCRVLRLSANRPEEEPATMAYK